MNLLCYTSGDAVERANALLTSVNRLVYSDRVPETKGNRDWRLEQIKADNRRRAVFFRPHIKSLLCPGLGEGALALAGILDRRYANLAMCLGTPIGVGARVTTPDQGGHHAPC